MSEGIEIDAGAVLLERAASGSRCRIAVIHRTKYGDWTLPKGHVEAGESLEQAAVREAREETGYDIEIIGLAGAMAYENKQRAKPVTYFYARPTSGPRQHNLDGVDQVLWLSYRDARRKLTHAEERRFLDWLSTEDGPLAAQSERKPGKQRLRLSPRLDRVVTALDVYEAELRGLRQRTFAEAAQPRPTASGERDSTWWRSPADELLNRARESCGTAPHQLGLAGAAGFPAAVAARADVGRLAPLCR